MKPLPRPSRSQVSVALGVLIALKLAILFFLAWHRRFVMDEFAQLGWAKYLGHELFDTVWPSKTVGFTVFIKLAHLAGGDAPSILLFGRMQTALLACGTLAILYGCARSLGQSRTTSALNLLVLLSFSNFAERIIETRAEPLAVFFGAAALLVAICRDTNRARIIVSGILGALAFLSTQKAIYLNVALGVALVGDAAMARQTLAGLRRGIWLVVGWLLPVAGYCVVFGGKDPLAVARNLYFGPLQVASSDTAKAYDGLREYVLQTLAQNMLLYAFCFGGMILALMQIRRLSSRNRIALIFTAVVTALVFAHNQPWPYVFVMALPFVSLWTLKPFNVLARHPRYRAAACALLAAGIALGFVRNAIALQIDNHSQLALVARAERLMKPGEVYFDGIGMLPNLKEPSTVWLDQVTIRQTLREGVRSQAYLSLQQAPPKLILWSYRLDAIGALIAPVMRASYVRIAPNTWIAGRRLSMGEPATFNVPITGTYALYGANGERAEGVYEVDGQLMETPVHLSRGETRLVLRGGPSTAFLLPSGTYAGSILAGEDDPELFADVYK